MRLTLILSLLRGGAAALPAAERPLLQEFIGINGHIVQFRPALRPVWVTESGYDSSTKPPPAPAFTLRITEAPVDLEFPRD